MRSGVTGFPSPGISLNETLFHLTNHEGPVKFRREKTGDGILNLIHYHCEAQTRREHFQRLEMGVGWAILMRTLFKVHHSPFWSYFHR